MFYWVYGMDTEESKRALIALPNVVLGRKGDPLLSRSGFAIQFKKDL